MTMRMIQCLEHPLHIDEVRKGLPEIGWEIFGESIDCVRQAVSETQPGYYRMLVANSDNGLMRLFALFSLEDGVLQLIDYTKYFLDTVGEPAAVGVPIPDSPNTIFSPELATRLIAYVEDRIFAYMEEEAGNLEEALEKARILGKSWKPIDDE